MITRLERRRSGSAYQRNEADGFFQANKKSELLPMRHYRGFDPSMNEPFVKPEVVGEFLQLDHATVVRYANAGFLPGYRLRESGQRRHWRFLLSEIKQSMLAKKPATGGPLRASGRPKQSY